MATKKKAPASKPTQKSAAKKPPTAKRGIKDLTKDDKVKGGGGAGKIKFNE